MTDRGVASGSAAGGRRRIARLLVLGLIGVGAAAAWRWRGALDPLALSALIGRYPAAPATFLVAHVAASLLFVPRTVPAIAAGLIFGLGWGTFWAALGSVVGAAAGFLVARYLGAGFLMTKHEGRLQALSRRVERGGWRTVAALRLIPVMPHSLANYGLGLTGLPLGAYIIGSLVGQLPMTIACVDLGAAGERLLLGRADWLVPSLVGAAALALSLLLPWAARRRSAGAVSGRIASLFGSVTPGLAPGIGVDGRARLGYDRNKTRQRDRKAL
jgi:uncharacterized membrane protein YdjX (TVP38/TMEM64 family)